MKNFRGILLCAFLFVGFAIASTDLFWFAAYLVACGATWCLVHLYRWLSWLFADDVKRMKQDKDKYYKRRGWK